MLAKVPSLCEIVHNISSQFALHTKSLELSLQLFTELQEATAIDRELQLVGALRDVVFLDKTLIIFLLFFSKAFFLTSAKISGCMLLTVSVPPPPPPPPPRVLLTMLCQHGRNVALCFGDDDASRPPVYTLEYMGVLLCPDEKYVRFAKKDVEYLSASPSHVITQRCHQEATEILLFC